MVGGSAAEVDAEIFSAEFLLIGARNESAPQFAD
jgi:hypothetical protein